MDRRTGSVMCAVRGRCFVTMCECEGPLFLHGRERGFSLGFSLHILGFKSSDCQGTGIRV